MNEPSPAVPEPTSNIVPASTPDPPVHVPSGSSPSTAIQQLMITLLFLGLGLGGGFIAWQVQSRFVVKAEPRMLDEENPDPEITLYGFEYVIQLLGISPRQSSFNVLDDTAGGGAPNQSTSPNPAAEMAQMRATEARQLKEVPLRRNRVAVYLLLLGIPLGAALGLAEGIRRRSVLLILGGILAGAILAGAAGFLGGGLHARLATLLEQRQDIDSDVVFIAPQFVAWLFLSLGLIAWPLTLSANLKTFYRLIIAAIVGPLVGSLCYAIVAQAVFYDDPFAHSLPGHVYSFLFWFIAASGMVSMSIGIACAGLQRRPGPQPT